MSISQIQIKSLESLLAKRQDILNNNVLPVGLPDAAAYFYFKQGSFLSKKQQKWVTFLFQGLNTNPQNLSIYLRDDAQRQNKTNKQKLIKGVFMVFDLFSKCDMVIQINIPGNLRIYKLINNKKQLVSNQQIDLMYLSSILRSMYQTNLPWGRFYHIFHDSKNFILELKNFYTILFKSIMKKDINIGNEFQVISNIKGSHACSLVFNYIKDRKLIQLSIQIIEQLLKKNKEYQSCPKYYILLSQLYLQFGKTSKCMQIISIQMQKYNRDPYLIYYQAKYLYNNATYEKALILCNSIVQYNQFQIWILLAQIHLELKHFGDLLICLNHSIKLSKIKGLKNLDIAYKGFQELGKIKFIGILEGIQHYPKLLTASQNPLNILVKEVQQKNKFLLQKGYWKLNNNQKLIYNIIRDLRYKLQIKKFQQLLMNTFQDNITKYEPILIKKGLTQSLFMEEAPVDKNSQRVQKSHRLQQQYQEQLPDFLKNSIDKVQQSVAGKPSRNLSIIQEIQSVIENSNYQQRQKDRLNKGIKYKREVNEGLFKIIKLVLGETDFQKAQYENNLAKILTIYNKMRTSSKYNNYYADRMFKIFVQTVNYKSIVVLIAQVLDFLEQKGVKKIDKLPYWMHKYLFFIIEEKGLKYLNDLLQKLNYYDQAIIDTIEIAKKWKLKGVTY